MVDLAEMTPEEFYVDRVVAYHQYRDEMGLTLAEARTEADTLAVFEELTEVVAEHDELRTAYIGVLRSRGKNREAATEQVRKLETDIVSEMHDWDLVTDAAYSKKRDELATDEGVKKAAEKFVALFTKVIPKEELPKQKKPVRKPRTQKQVVREEEPEIEQATMFVVEKDVRGALRINGTELELADAPGSLLSTLIDLHERDPELHMRVDTIKGGRRWQAVQQAARLRGEAEPGYSDAMSELRETLHSLGLENLIDADGSGRGRTYRAKVDDLRYVRTFEKAEEAAEKTPLPARPIVEPEPKDPTKEFFEKLEAFSEEAVPDPEAGILISAMRRRVAKELDLGMDEATEFVNNMLRGGLLYVIDNEKGVRIVSPKARETAGSANQSQAEQLASTEQEQMFHDQEMEVVAEILELIADSEVLRGQSLKSLRLRHPEHGKQINSIVRRLADKGYLDLYENSSKRNRRRPFVRFASLAVMQRTKTDTEQLLKEIANLTIEG